MSIQTRLLSKSAVFLTRIGGWVCVLAISLLLYSCSDEMPSEPGTFSPTSGRGAIKSASLLQSKALNRIESELAAQNVPIQPQYALDMYRIVYETIGADGGVTEASGVIVIPKGATKALPMLAYQHGTVVERSDVNSVYGFDLESIALGASGYITVIADYLGLGASQGVHPYVHAPSLATAVVDMIRAGESFCRARGIAWNQQLFLMGYSEGGYATMAAHRELEEKHAGEFTVTASAPMAGPYDLSETMKGVMLSDTPYPFPLYLPYTIVAYNNIYHTFGSLTEVFREPYASMIPDLFDGNHGFWEVNGAFPDIPKQMLTESFLESLESDPDNPMLKALQQNDLYNWNPVAPVRMYHCTGDDQVPYSNAVVAYNAFTGKGLTNVELVTLELGDHYDCGLPAQLLGKLWFDTLVQ